MKIDFELGYIKSDTEDKMDYFNRLPQKIKLDCVQRFIREKTEEIKHSRKKSNSLASSRHKVRESIVRKSVVFDEDQFEVKTEEEYMKCLSSEEDDDQEFIREINDLPKPEKTKEFEYIWLVRLFPGEAL